ncbi:hypothetical protein SDC9_22946 [bioreactor metagenome]|uniref:Sporulation stage II protein D amidase enhancer LytB N-terminal domain-containing protein n=1 Tax=bioreactor metagenome TaxID=1076179 RepID=A0A644UDM8_9ZZZZ|nr:SpoIID/LytB domain-containing protein [Negativicutes bacterium]
MQRIRNMNIVIIFVVVVAIVTGVYGLLRSPAPKQNPEAPPVPSAPAPNPVPTDPMPGVPKFDTEKYKTEPVVSVYRADKGTIESMLLEKYLEGVIAKEMHPEWPVPALAAQAIASRTLTLSAIEAGTIKKLRGADVSTSKEELQAYAPEKVNDNVREAVRMTRGQILLYDGTLVNAIYSSCNAQVGATKEESFPTEIKGPTPYFQPVADNCLEFAPAEQRNWTVKIPGSEVAAAIGYKGNPQDITILERGPSGRILYIGAGDKKIYGSDFRKRVGYDRLKSTLITEMSYDGRNFVFKGMGWGNGVGLCQWGAYADAQYGKNAIDMITHYYPGTTLTKVWE